MEKVSIIVPIYNAEKYLKRCVDSLLIQTYKDIEIILVDDGSKDSCYDICEEYVIQDNRIRCLHLENGGLSYARNNGMSVATGRYIMFIDADDYYEYDTVKVMMDSMRDDVELAVAKYNIVREGVIEEVIGSDDEGIHSCEKYMGMAFEPETDFYFGVAWNKLYLRNIIMDNHILFKKEVTLCEDLHFNLKYLKYVKKVAVVAHIINNYEQGNPVSLIKKVRPRGDSWCCKSYVYDAYMELYTMKGLYEQYKKDIANALMVAVVQEIKEIVEFEGKLYSGRKLRKIIQKFCEDDKVSLSARECRIDKKLENLTAKLITKKKYRKIMHIYKLKKFVKDNMGFLHDYAKNKSMAK